MLFQILRTTSAASLIVAALTASSAVAQVATSPALPQPLTLADALRIAHELNPVYRVHEAELDENEARERANASWLNYVPTLRFGLTASAMQRRELAGRDNFGRPIALDEPITFRQTDFDLGPRIGQVTLFDGGAEIRNTRSTRAALQGDRARIAGEALGAESDVILAYYAAVGAEQQVASAARQVELTRVNLDAANRLLRVGQQDPLDVLSAELEALRAENELARLEGNARISKLALLGEMGIAQEIELTLADELPMVFDPSTVSPESLVALALGNSPQIAMANAAAEQSRYTLLNARAGRWPTLNASLGISPGNPVGNGADPLFYLNPMNQTYRAALSVEFNLFDRLQTSTNVASARAAYMASTESQRAQRLQVGNRVRELLIELENIYRRIDLQDRTAALSLEQVELSQQKYRLGSMTFRDLQVAIDNAAQAEEQALNARMDFARTLVDLELLVGRRLER
jgi:outer membrane protein